MLAGLTLWSHALAALLFGLLALLAARGRCGAGLPRAVFATAAAATALWALAVAGIDPRDAVTRVAQGVRNIAWLALLFALARREHRIGASSVLYMVVAVVTGVTIAVGVGELTVDSTAAGALLGSTRSALGTLAALAVLYLCRQLWADGTVLSVPRGRLLLAATVAIWGSDALFHVARTVAPTLLPAMTATRGPAMVIVAGLCALGALRGADSGLHLSRSLTLRAILASAVAGYGLVVALVTAALGDLGGAHARPLQTAFVFGFTTALLALVSTPWVRAWTGVVVAKHLFRHRYDYRTEWLRCSETLGAVDAAPLEQRVIRAIAGLTDSPSGLLLIRAEHGLELAADWRWSGDFSVERTDDAQALATHLETTRRIVALDEVRDSTADPAVIDAVPGWLRSLSAGWAIVPLIHLGRLVGAVVLARGLVERALDWEDFDALGVAGRQAASYLAEERAHSALAEVERFEEFNRRFAFIIHDLKNLVSQHSLVARNAERHADNPAFRADMIETLRDSAQRMTALLSRLTQAQAPQPSGEPLQRVAVRALAEQLAAARRVQHPIVVRGDASAIARADRSGLELLLGHLLQNAIEASAPDAPVEMLIVSERDHVAIDVADHGCGMTPAFVRDALFKPFASSKENGFGLGAFEARKLAEGMGGHLSVSSREGEGTRFRVILPLATKLEEAA